VLAYDATLLLVEALLKTKIYTREGLEEALNSIHRFDGVTGKTIFSAKSAPIKSLVLLSVDHAQRRVVETIEPKGDLK
jgi:ABC-type branched-subunit amino acid transport system substrate-binding protein